MANQQKEFNRSTILITNKENGEKITGGFNEVQLGLILQAKANIVFHYKRT